MATRLTTVTVTDWLE